MSPIAMSVLLVVTLGFFVWTAWRRWRLLAVGQSENRFDQPGVRFKHMLKYAVGQLRMPRYPWAGIAHILIFSGFLVLLLRTLILWGRGYDENFNGWIFGVDQPLGKVYAVLKDTFILLVLAGTLVFMYYRMIARPARITRGIEGLIILFIIFVMMIADVVYDGARMAQSGEFHRIEYVGYVVGQAMQGLSLDTLRTLEHLGFWTHASLVLFFLNLLPYSKHFHVITALPNVYFANLKPRGRLAPVEDIEGKIEREEPLGAATIDHFSWKSILDMYTCTECGRCSDVCPATHTGKLLSPKHYLLNLRDHLYSRQDEVMKLPRNAGSNGNATSEQGDGSETNGTSTKLEPISLVSEDRVKPEVLWACTTCRACEEECPVFITYVDKIVDMRRNLVMEQAVFPDELQNAFRGLETNGNPWSYPPEDRMQWAEGLEVPTMADSPEAEILFWIGCAPAFDARARNVTIATVKLLQAAGVKFAVLGLEETCTGDAARRAGNEFLFQMLAEQNVEVMNGYNVRRIMTTCPHCFNTLKNEYPDFGGNYEVISHTDFLLDLVRQGRLKTPNRVDATVTYHDSCYLGRYNDVYDSPRDILRSIPGVRLVEPAKTRDRGMCCGAGGAQMFKEEEHGRKRVNTERTEQLLHALDQSPKSGDTMVASACPFCMRMLTDGIADNEREEVAQLDVAEILCKSAGV